MIHKKNILIFIMLAVFIFQCSDNNLPDDGTVKIIHNESKIWGNSPQISLELVNTIGGLDEDDENAIFMQPTDVFLDAEGFLYIVDSQNSRVQVYNPDREYYKTIGRKGEGPGEFLYPTHIDVMDNKFLISSGYQRKIHYFTLDGAYIETFSTNKNLSKVIPLQSGKFAIYAPGYFRRSEDNNLVFMMDNNAIQLYDFVEPNRGKFGRKFGSTGNDFWMTSDSQENIYVSFKFQNRIEKYSSIGDLLMQITRKKPFTESSKHEKDIIEQINGFSDFFVKTHHFSWDIGVDNKNRIWVLSQKRQMTLENGKNMDYTDLYLFEIYTPDGLLLGEIDIEVFSQWGSFRIFDDKLFIIDTANEMNVKEFRIVEK